MVHDSDTYRKAASVSLAGLFVQAGLALVLGLLAAYTQSAAVMAACWLVLLGLPAWVVLQLIFSQQRRERDEAREAQALAARAAAGSMFEEATLLEVRRRIERLHRWGLPSVSLGIALLQMGLGGLLCWMQLRRYRELPFDAVADLRPGVNPVLAALLLLLVALAAFFMARYIAGMTREKAWAALRGGASVLLIACLVAAGLGLALALAVWGGFPRALHVAAIALSGFTALLGTESLVILLLSLYRPKRAGEALRPAFDSRLLGWLTAPKSLGQTLAETLRYQFGLEVSGSWAFKLVSRAVLPMSAAALALLWLCSCFFIVAPHERAVVLVRGRMGELAGPGLHFKPPWPLATVQGRVEVDRLRRVVVCTPGGALPGTSEELLMTSGGEMIAAEVTVLYRVAAGHEKAFVQSSEDPEALIAAGAADALARHITRHRTLDLIGPGRAGASAALKADLAAALPVDVFGIEVVEVSLSGMRPPKDAADGFLEMVNARQEREKMAAEARRESGMMLTAVAGSQEQARRIRDAIDAYNAAAPEGKVAARSRVEALIESAGGQAAESLANARADRWRRDLAERSAAQEFSAYAGPYRIAPAFLKERLMSEAREAMAGRHKVILTRDPAGRLPALDFNLSDTAGAGNLLGGK